MCSAASPGNSSEPGVQSLRVLCAACPLFPANSSSSGGVKREESSQVCFWCITAVFCSQLAVANNRIITLQEEMERVKEESSYILESSRKVGVCVWGGDC